MKEFFKLTKLKIGLTGIFLTILIIWQLLIMINYSLIFILFALIPFFLFPLFLILMAPVGIIMDFFNPSVMNLGGNLIVAIANFLIIVIIGIVYYYFVSCLLVFTVGLFRNKKREKK